MSLKINVQISLLILLVSLLPSLAAALELPLVGDLGSLFSDLPFVGSLGGSGQASVEQSGSID